MNSPVPPADRPLRRIAGACPFCNEGCAELWLDPARAESACQVRCGFCGARGPWGDEVGAVEGWKGVTPRIYDEDA